MSLQLGHKPCDSGYHISVLFTAVSLVPGTVLAHKVFKEYLLKEWKNAQFYNGLAHAKIKKTES